MSHAGRTPRGHECCLSSIPERSGLGHPPAIGEMASVYTVDRLMINGTNSNKLLIKLIDFLTFIFHLVNSYFIIFL